MQLKFHNLPNYASTCAFAIMILHTLNALMIGIQYIAQLKFYFQKPFLNCSQYMPNIFIYEWSYLTILFLTKELTQSLNAADD